MTAKKQLNELVEVDAIAVDVQLLAVPASSIFNRGSEMLFASSISFFRMYNIESFYFGSHLHKLYLHLKKFA